MIKTTQLLLILKAIFWLILSCFYFYWKTTQNPGITAYQVSGMMIVNAIVAFSLAWGLSAKNKFKKTFYILAVIFILGNIFLTITDQFGYWDLASLIIDTAIIIALFLGRKMFLKPMS